MSDFDNKKIADQPSDQPSEQLSQEQPSQGQQEEELKEKVLRITPRQEQQILGRIDGTSNSLRLAKTKAQALAMAKANAAHSLSMPPYHQPHILSHYGFDFPYRVEDLAKLTDGRLAEAMAHPDFPLDDCPIELWPRIIRYMKAAWKERRANHFLEEQWSQTNRYNPLTCYVDAYCPESQLVGGSAANNGTQREFTAEEIAAINAGELRFRQPQTAVNFLLKVQHMGNNQIYIEPGPSTAPFIYDRFSIYPAWALGGFYLAPDPASENTKAGGKAHFGSCNLYNYSFLSANNCSIHMYNQGSFVQDKGICLTAGVFSALSLHNIFFEIDHPTALAAQGGTNRYPLSLNTFSYCYLNMGTFIGRPSSQHVEIVTPYYTNWYSYIIMGMQQRFVNLKIHHILNAGEYSHIKVNSGTTFVAEDYELIRQYFIRGKSSIWIIPGISSLPAVSNPSDSNSNSVSQADSIVY